MYFMMIGTTYKISENKLYLNVNNIVYDINISEHSLKDLKEGEVDTSVFILEKISENSHELFGFIDEEEKRLFEKIIKIPKVGHKTAMNVFNVFGPNELIELISLGDVKSLKKIKGFGEKGIMALMHELRNETVEVDKSLLEIKNKLIELGMNEKDFQSFIEDKKDLNQEQIVKEYLKGLS